MGRLAVMRIKNSDDATALTGPDGTVFVADADGVFDLPHDEALVMLDYPGWVAVGEPEPEGDPVPPLDAPAEPEAPSAPVEPEAPETASGPEPEPASDESDTEDAPDGPMTSDELAEHAAESLAEATKPARKPRTRK